MPDPKSPETEAGATATPETETTNLPEPEATIEDAPTETETEAAETAEGTEEEKGKKKDWNPDLAKLNQERANFRKEQEAAEAKLAAAKAALEAEKAKLANAKPPEPDPEDAEMAEVKKLLVQADEMSDPDKDGYDPVAAQRLKIKADLKKVDIEEKRDREERNRRKAAEQVTARKTADERWWEQWKSEHADEDVTKAQKAASDCHRQAREDGFTSDAATYATKLFNQKLKAGEFKKSKGASSGKGPAKKTDTATGESTPPGTTVRPSDAGVRIEPARKRQIGAGLLGLFRSNTDIKQNA